MLQGGASSNQWESSTSGAGRPAVQDDDAGCSGVTGERWIWNPEKKGWDDAWADNDSDDSDDSDGGGNDLVRERTAQGPGDCLRSAFTCLPPRYVEEASACFMMALNFSGGRGKKGGGKGKGKGKAEGGPAR